MTEFYDGLPYDMVKNAECDTSRQKEESYFVAKTIRDTMRNIIEEEGFSRESDGANFAAFLNCDRFPFFGKDLFFAEQDHGYIQEYQDPENPGIYLHTIMLANMKETQDEYSVIAETWHVDITEDRSEIRQRLAFRFLHDLGFVIKPGDLTRFVTRKGLISGSGREDVPVVELFHPERELAASLDGMRRDEKGGMIINYIHLLYAPRKEDFA